MAKNNNWNNGDRHKIHEIFLINCFAFVIIPVWQTVHFGNDSNYSKFIGEEDIATNCSKVTVLALDGLTKKRFGHYALLKFFPSDHQEVGKKSSTSAVLPVYYRPVSNTSQSGP